MDVGEVTKGPDSPAETPPQKHTRRLVAIKREVLGHVTRGGPPAPDTPPLTHLLMSR